MVALLALRDAAVAGWDLVVADAGPLDAAVALAALPATLTRLLERVLPLERRMLWAMGHGAAPGVPVPGRGAVEAVERLHAELAAAATLLASPATSARLVVTAEPAAPAQALRARTALALPVSPSTASSSTGSCRPGAPRGWRPAPPRSGGCWRTSPARSPPCPSPASPSTPNPCSAPPPWRTSRPVSTRPPTIRRHPRRRPRPPPPSPPEWNATGTPTCSCSRCRRPARATSASPAAGTSSLLDVAGMRRAVSLPSVLRRCEVAGAALRDGALRVAFRPDPALWRSA